MRTISRILRNPDLLRLANLHADDSLLETGLFNLRWLRCTGLFRLHSEYQLAHATFWSLLTGSVLVGLLALIAEMPQQLATMTLLDASVLIYLGVFSSGMTFWLTQRATAVLTPAAVTAYSYLVPFASMLLLLIGQPQRMGWYWLPGSLLVVLAITLLLKPDAAAKATYPITAAAARWPSS